LDKRFFRMSDWPIGLIYLTSVLIYSPSCSKPKIRTRKTFIRLSKQKWFSFIKNIFTCFLKMKKSYRFGTTWGSIGWWQDYPFKECTMGSILFLSLDIHIFILFKAATALKSGKPAFHSTVFLWTQSIMSKTWLISWLLFITNLFIIVFLLFKFLHSLCVCDESLNEAESKSNYAEKIPSKRRNGI